MPLLPRVRTIRRGACRVVHMQPQRGLNGSTPTDGDGEDVPAPVYLAEHAGPLLVGLHRGSCNDGATAGCRVTGGRRLPSPVATAAALLQGRSRLSRLYSRAIGELAGRGASWLLVPQLSSRADVGRVAGT